MSEQGQRASKGLLNICSSPQPLAFRRAISPWFSHCPWFQPSDSARQSVPHVPSSVV